MAPTLSTAKRPVDFTVYDFSRNARATQLNGSVDLQISKVLKPIDGKVGLGGPWLESCGCWDAICADPSRRAIA